MIKKILIKTSGNSAVQKILEKNIYFSQYLSGIGSGTYAEKSGEKIVFETLKKKCDPPFCIFDIGSNKGQYLKLINKYLSSCNYKVHCFEPHTESYNILKSMNKDSNVIINNLALAETEGEKNLYFHGKNTELACLTKRRLEHFNIVMDSSEIVKVDTVDNYSTKNGIKKINLLKIDVEGHEYDVLKGAANMFENNRIDLVTFEFGGTGIDTKIFFQDYYYFFKNYNKILYRITPSGYLLKIDKYSEIHEQFRTTNFLVLNN